ncbi:hypothetical protein QCA50_006460 [Cerrena zonata]|uniref:Uncharacterized protein n=1 Tax=Cerrena zonata TaxID=2478898 RepID=A0AAW0GJY9_9APHY
MYTIRSSLFVLAAVLVAMVSAAATLPSTKNTPVPKTNEHAGAAVNIPKQRADPADMEWVKRGSNGLGSHTELISRDNYANADISTPLGGKKISPIS